MFSQSNWFDRKSGSIDDIFPNEAFCKDITTFVDIYLEILNAFASESDRIRQTYAKREALHCTLQLINNDVETQYN